MGLDSTAVPYNVDADKYQMDSDNNKLISSSCSSVAIRPQVPPRTKFLSPNERGLMTKSSPGLSEIGKSEEGLEVVTPNPVDEQPKTPYKVRLNLFHL